MLTGIVLVAEMVLIVVVFLDSVWWAIRFNKSIVLWGDWVIDRENG